MQVSYIFKERIPSKKNSRITLRNGMTIPSKSYKAWEDIELFLIRSKIKVRKIDNAEINYRFYSPDKRLYDLSNKVESIQDLLVKAEILKDDNLNVIYQYDVCYCGIDKGKFCEICITF